MAAHPDDIDFKAWLNAPDTGFLRVRWGGYVAEVAMHDDQLVVSYRMDAGSGGWSMATQMLELVAQRLRIAHLRSLPYEEYLKTEHWQAIREREIEAAHGVCGFCFKRAPWLEIHHRTYERRGEEPPQDLVALCRQCHEAMHGPKAAAMRQTLENVDLIRQLGQMKRI